MNRPNMYAVEEYNADGTSNGYTTTYPLGKEQAEKNAAQCRKWAKEDESGKTYKIVKMYLQSA
jgi:hypothetical protein